MFWVVIRILAAGFLYSATVNFSENISTRSKETLVIVLGTDSGGHIQQKQDRAIVLVGGSWMLIMMYGWLSQIQHALEAHPLPTSHTKDHQIESNRLVDFIFHAAHND